MLQFPPCSSAKLQLLQSPHHAPRPNPSSSRALIQSGGAPIEVSLVSRCRERQHGEEGEVNRSQRLSLRRAVDEEVEE